MVRGDRGEGIGCYY